MSKSGIRAIYYAVIIGLFYLDRRPRERTGAGLWVVFAWLFFVLSKSPAACMQRGQTTSYDESYNLESNPINLVVFAVIILSGLIVLGARWNRVAKSLQASWPILLFYAYCGLSCAWSEYPDVVFKKWIRCLGDPIIILIILTEIEPATALKRLYARLGFVLLPLSCRSARVRRSQWAVHLVVVGLLFGPLYTVYFNRELVTNVGRNPTLTGRTDLWKQCLKIAGNPLVGTGFESFWLGWRIQRIWDQNVGIRLNEAHNGYLELYLQLGWCGALLLAVGLAMGYLRTVRVLRSD